MALIEKLKFKKKSKFGNTWVIIDKIKFQSEGEGKYYLRLKDDLIKGEIAGFKRQVVYKLSVNGVWICDYQADFVVLHNDNRIEVLDYKSVFTEGLVMFRMKKALMLVCHNIIVTAVGKGLKK